MIQLTPHSLTQVRRVPVVSMGLVLKEVDTTASLVPESMSGLNTESWLLDDTNPGKGIVYRVQSIKTDYGTNTPTIQLEHVIQCLGDQILFGEITAAMMGGGTTCTAKQAVQYILKRSSDWTLGKWETNNPSNAYKFDGDTLLDALETVKKTLDDCRWTYDLSAYPFKLNFIKKITSNPCELRPGRNLVTVSRTIEKSGMYTRFFPIGKNDLHIPGEYMQKNTGTYGVKEKSEVDTSRETVADLQAWANQRLKIHAQPRVNVVADGLNLSAATGEDLDKLTVLRPCKIPLEEFSTTIEEEIVELNYRDKVNEPENVRVTMANEQEDVLKILANEIKEGAGPNGSGRGGGGRGGARQAKEDNAWFEDTNEHVAMCARGIIGVDANGKVNWERLSRLDVDGGGIHGSVVEMQNGIGIMEGRLELTESSFEATVQAIGSGGKITAASICLAINQAGSQANISADHIILTGKTKINDILAVESGSVYIRSPLRVNGTVMTSGVDLRSGGSGITINDSLMAGVIKKAEITSGGQLRLTPVRGDPITFNKAIDRFNLGWVGGVFTAEAKPQNQSCWTEIAGGSPEWENGKVKIPIVARNSSAPGTTVQTGKEVEATISWSYSTYASESSGQPSGGAKYYDLDTRYAYHSFYVTVGGESKLIVCRTS